MSIITVVYNGAAGLERTIESIVKQKYDNIEYIVVDGGSTDGTLEIIERNKDNIDYWLSEPDEGISDAFNKGIAASSGDIIGILNADDWYEHDAVALVAERFAHDQSDIVHGMTQYWNGAEKADLVSGNDACLAMDMTMSHPTVFVTRRCYERFGVYRREFRCAMDYEWLLRAKITGATFSYVAACLVNMKQGGISDRAWRLAVREVTKAKTFYLPGRYRHYCYFAYQILKGSMRRLMDALGLRFITRFYHANLSLVKKINPDD